MQWACHNRPVALAGPVLLGKTGLVGGTSLVIVGKKKPRRNGVHDSAVHAPSAKQCMHSQS
jgi:hypothetical protein